MNLNHAETKLRRASEHLDELKTELRKYFASDPCSIRRYEDHQAGRRFLRVEIKDLSDRVYLLVGDFAHNLRCVLDHIVYSLVIKGTGSAPDSRRTQWPVMTVPDARLFEKQTKGVPAAAVDVIAGLQPYHVADVKAAINHPLWQLHMLDVVDKHRRLAINRHEFNAIFPTLTPGSDFTLATGDKYFEISFALDAPPVPMDFDPAPDIMFGAAEVGLFVSPQRLEEIFSLVADDVLPRFRVFFS